MFNIGIEKVLFVSLAALLILGPQELPNAMRQLGRAYGEYRRFADRLRSDFDSAVVHSEDVLHVPQPAATTMTSETRDAERAPTAGPTAPEGATSLPSTDANSAPISAPAPERTPTQELRS